MQSTVSLPHKKQDFYYLSFIVNVDCLLLVKIICVVLLLPSLLQSGEIQNLRNQRYCEILIGRPPFLHVYNTIGLNNCPADQWNKITVPNIKKETGALFVHLNGPRYWMIDGMKHSELINPKVRVLGGIAMREAGVLKLSLLDLWAGIRPYRSHQVHRQTTWIYQAGKPIYEIVDSQGNVYAMQSYSIQRVLQTEESLPKLGSKLHLPNGWSFRIRILQENAYLTALNEQAIVIQDEFLNTYQQETPIFISGRTNE